MTSTSRTTSPYGNEQGQSAPLDTRYQVETPEGIDLVLRPASLLPRALAYTVDLLIRGILLLVLYSVFLLLGQFGMGLGLIVTFLVTWWYMVLFEVLNQGRSPGKHLMGLRVVHDDGTPVGWSSSLVRNLLRFVDILPFGYALGILSTLMHPAFKRLGDLAAGTLVVYREDKPSRPQLPDAEPQRAPFILSLTEQRAILGYAERQAGLSSGRRAELAGILAEPLEVPAEQAEARLNGIARSLLGSP
ncbi:MULTISPECIES: RDD family protein [Pseudomonas]|uniref:RDD family protein n=1 Tax=Pseudomonas tohonis TaxID=2725477 RepID=A0A6J4E0M5_9PSED|nr:MULTISPECIES: RDD family protein [Pseudomonas]BBP81680.1 RDD family protein [Pseudomonas sp. Pc102]BCG23240.1 RDD family protein [Pseudomonas tohonis]GJN55275.1 RDD family protein [Pseudomonas tohonis]